MKIDFVDLKSQYTEIKPEIDRKLHSLFTKGDFILGEEVRRFEQSFAKYCGCKYAVGLNSGTDALFLGLVSLGIGKGDEVIVPAFTFIATALAVSYTGAKPVFVDIEEETYNIDPKKVKEAISKRTRAIIPVHLFGQPADMDELAAIARAHNLKIIEDTCQAHGAQYKRRHCGSLGDVGCFSFYPTKNLGGFGDGGLATTSSKKIYEKLIMLRDCGRKGRYAHIVKGYNSRLDTVQAVVLNAKLKRLDKWNKLRRKNAQLYTQFLRGQQGIITPFEKSQRYHVYHVYGLRIKNRDMVYNRLRKKAIGVHIHYPIPLHLQKAYQELGYKRTSFPVAEAVSKEIISLPMHPFLKKAQIQYVAEEILKRPSE